MRNVLTYTMKHKEQLNTSAFDRVFVGCKKIDRSKEEDRQGVDVKAMLRRYT